MQRLAFVIESPQPDKSSFGALVRELFPSSDMPWISALEIAGALFPNAVLPTSMTLRRESGEINLVVEEPSPTISTRSLAMVILPLQNLIAKAALHPLQE